MDKLQKKVKELYKSIKNGIVSAKDKTTEKISSMAKKTSKKTRKRRVNRSSAGKSSGVRVPTHPVKRFFWYLNPHRFKDFWFTKQGFKKALKFSFIAFLVGLAAIVGVFAYVAKDLPSPGQINSRILAQTTKFYDRTGQHLLYEVFGDQNRSVVDLNDISDNLKNATISVEDKDFYHHNAFDVTGIIRAVWGEVTNNPSLGGGSTITQQYVKNALLSPERSYVRKAKELILSIQIEQLYDKNDILELYLNEIPYGSTAYGAEAASKMYFSKDAKDLSIDEAAMLAALPQAPTYYSPYGENTDALVARQKIVIDKMQQQGYITQEEAEKAKSVDILAKVNDVPDMYKDIFAPHFTLHVQRLLEEKYGARKVNEGGLTVITTLDYDKQKLAEQSVKDGMPAVDRLGGDNAALVAADPNNGEVLAMVGSRDFKYPGFGAYNAALSGRQPGSSFKPYAYATLFKQKHWGPGSVMYDVPTDFGGGYKPHNFDNGYRGFMTIRTALGESRNIPAIKALYIAGVQNVIDQAHKMGITTLENPKQYGLSLVLGSGEVKLADHVNAYSSFATGGIHHPQSYILKVSDSQGNVLEEYKPDEGERVLDPQVAYLISSILTDDSARSATFGYHSPYLYFPNHTIAVKTGTTDFSRDGWMMGYSKDIVAGVWVGNHDNKPMYSVTSQQSGPIWHQFMAKVHEGLADKPFEKPSGIKTVTLDAYTGKLPTDGTKSTRTDVFPSWYEAPGITQTKTAVIDTVSNKLATDCTPDAAKKEVTAISGVNAEIPPDDPAYYRWNPPVVALARSKGLATGYGGSIPTEKDDVHKCSDKPPLVNSFNGEQSGDTISLNADVSSGTFQAEKIEFIYKGQVISTKSLSGDGKVSIDYKPKNGNGDYNFSVKVTDKGLYSSTSDTTVKYKESSSTKPDNGGLPAEGDGAPPATIQSYRGWWHR